MRGVHTRGAKGEFTAFSALSHILAGTGFEIQRDRSGAVGIVRTGRVPNAREEQFAQAQPRAAASSVDGGRYVFQNQGRHPDGSDCDHRAFAGTIYLAPDRGRARSGEGSAQSHLHQNEFHRLFNPNSRYRNPGHFRDDRPAVAVAFNDIPFIRNHFFEQEFFDISKWKCCAGRKEPSMAATRPPAS